MSNNPKKMYQTYNAPRGKYLSLNYRAGLQSSDARLVCAMREKLIRSGKPALEVVKDGFTTIGTATVFDALDAVPTGVESYQVG